MEESLANSQPEEIWPSLLKSDISLLLVLLFLATAIRVWLIAHTEVTSRDSIGYQRYAWELEQDNWKQVLRKNVHHPLYPVTILAISGPVRQLVGGSEVTVMQLSAQLASGLAGILLVVPTFFLGKELFDRKVGFWASAIFQCLPVGARVMSDALSESLFLLMSATALLLAVRAFRTGSWRQFGLCGLFAGLAYLTRPEGILIVVAVILVLFRALASGVALASRVLPALTQPGSPGQETGDGRRALVNIFGIARCLASLIIGFAMFAGPYIATIGGFSNKTTTQDVLQTVGWAESSRPAFEVPCSIFDISCFWEHRTENEFRISNKEYRTLRFSVLAIVGLWWPDGKVSYALGHLGWSFYALGSEISKGFFYVAWIPALLGLFMFRARGPLNAGRTVLPVLCLLQCLALLRVAFVAGYVADRHVLIIVLCGLYWAVVAIFYLIESLLTLRVGVRTPTRSVSEVRTKKITFSWLSPSAAWLFVALIGLALPKTLAPLHANRAGHHAVGVWLAEHVTSADEIDDPFCWAAHYAGRTF